MKTKELIKRLSDLDPTGDIECCVSNEDIFSVTRVPSYYDGALQVLKRDADVSHYNVTGAELRYRGDKIVIKTLSLETAVFIDKDLDVHCDDERLKIKIENIKRDVANRKSNKVIKRTD